MKLLRNVIIMITVLVLLAEPLDVYGEESGQDMGNATMQAEEKVQDDTQKKTGNVSGDETGDTSWNSLGDTEADSSGTVSAVRLMIDNKNRYAGMDKTYSEGYVPRVENGSVYLVVPILCSGKLKENSLSVSLNLGDSANAPFVMKNYEKNIRLRNVKVNDKSEKVKSYVASFGLELKEQRVNGSYPVILSVWAADESENEIRQDFTVYVTITDGKDPNAEPVTETATEPEPSTEEVPTFAPKVLVKSCQCSGTDIQSGDEVTVDITLENTSRTESVKNMTVTASAPAEQFTLLSESDTVYVDAVPAEGTFVVSYRYRINASAPQGQYTLELAMDYADTKGSSYQGSGRVKLSVEQPLKVEFDSLYIPSEVTVADVVEAQVQAMNLGRSKVYNVRAVIEADGLNPQGTIFIGDLEPGTQASGSTQVSVSSLSGEGGSYGETEGTVTFYYEDEAGEEQTEVMEFQTKIAFPFSETPKEEEDKTGQWWIIMAVIGGVLCIFAGFVIEGMVRRGNQHEVVE